MKTYFTFLERNKLFTFVNVAGLSISLMFVLLIANMVTRQLTVDKDLPDADRIYVFANEHWAGGHYNLGNRLQSRYPEIEDWCAIKVSNPYVQPDDKPVQVLGASVKKNFFEFFRFPLLEGNREQLLTDDNSVVLTRSAALRLFGTEHAVGKTLKIIPCNNGIFTVTGIVEDINNSIIPSDIDIFIPFENMKYIQWSCSMECTEMNNAAGSTLFFRTAPGADLNRKADDVVAFLREFYWLFRDSDSFKKVQFIPWHDFYFSETPATVYLNQYDFKLVVIFITIGALILLMAILNYISMSVAQTSYRAKEMATRRLLGSSRPDIFWRMIAESALLTLVSFIIGFLLAKAAEPVAIDLLHAKLDITGDLNATTVIVYILFIAALTLLSGFIPATILSNYNPMDVVKGTFRRKTKAVYLRVLNIVQCGLTIALLTCSAYLSVQIYRIVHAPLGYEYGNVLTYPSYGSQKNLQLFRTEAKKLPFVKHVSFSCGIPLDGGNNNTTYIPSADSTLEMSFQTFIVDSAFLDIYHIQITEDRHTPIGGNNFFLSERAMKMLEPVGTKDYFTSNNYGRTQIAGVFKDFVISRSLIDHDIHPLQIQIEHPDSIYPWNISVEVQDGDLNAYKKEIDQLYKIAAKDFAFESAWYGDQLKELYSDFSRMNRLMLIFTGAALLISLLGLTAMSLYFIAQRKRDMAIHKVFGSSSLGEQERLMKFSLVSLGISLVIAIPLMLFGVHQIDKIVTFDSAFPWWVPIASIAFIAFVSLASVYLISRKATRENPVENLKTE
ncbi:ABC transporter permease [Bacteroides sp. An322]|uniref:ABC transporter permease n=1 Tax=Bacteroides sp. An322 TaxID=1965632 RepID=UPI000B382D47|nr:ABC transporter permease [Bacteroides sp. An322]OUO19596.1 hypothetical protein B5F91_08120 [Bacteroides sp. An322]